MTVKHEFHYWVDGYGNEYRVYLKPEPDGFIEHAGEFQAQIRFKSGKFVQRWFKKKKSARNWLERRYQTKQKRFLQVQERKRQRAEERKMKPKKAPDKVALAEKAVDEAMEKLKELDRKEALLTTLRKRWTRRLGARLAYAKKLRSTSIEAALVEANPD